MVLLAANWFGVVMCSGVHTGYGFTIFSTEQHVWLVSVKCLSIVQLRYMES